MKSIGILACGLVFLSGTAPAAAQTTVTRQITTEPVETTTTNGPNGTIVTRRVLDPAPLGGDHWTVPPLQYVPNYSPPVVAEKAGEPEAATVRRTPRSRVRTARGNRGNAVAITRKEPRRQVARSQDGSERLALSPAQRQIVYRTIVQREVYPASARPALRTDYPPVVAETEVVAPPARSYPLRTVYPFPNDNAYYYDRYDYRSYDDGYMNGANVNSGYVYDRYSPRQVYPTATYPTAYVVGSRISDRVPLVAVPDSVALQIPATRSYSYAQVNGRVYLVDPVTSAIVADVTP